MALQGAQPILPHLRTATELEDQTVPAHTATKCHRQLLGRSGCILPRKAVLGHFGLFAAS